MNERNPSRSPRLTTLIAVGLVALLAIGAAVLLTQDDDAPVRGLPSGVDETTGGDGDVPATPAFRFTKATRELVRTAPGRVKRRQRQASERAAIAARTILDDLYTEGFLDPANREQGLYMDAFRGFAGGARKQAEARPGLLTAGSRAGERYERILPLSGRIDTRILLSRGDKPMLLLSVVRFKAAALGPDPATLRSRGQFFFERIDGSWKIVSFYITRTDARREAT